MIVDFFARLLAKAPCRPQDRDEVARLLEELLAIGRAEDYLSERPGPGFNAQCRHVRTRAIGQRLDELGGLPLMLYAYHRVQRKRGADCAAHLEYAWAEIGQWMV